MGSFKFLGKKWGRLHPGVLPASADTRSGRAWNQNPSRTVSSNCMRGLGESADDSVATLIGDSDA